MIWASIFLQDYIAVKTCLELNEFEVWVRNEVSSNALAMESVSGTELWILDERYQEAIELLYNNELINELQYNEATTPRQEESDPYKTGIKPVYVLGLIVAVVIFFFIRTVFYAR